MSGWRNASCLFLIVVSLILGIFGGFFTAGWQDVPAPLAALVGVVLGGLISSGTSLVTTRETRRAQIAMATWAERVRAHQEAYNLTRKLEYVYNTRRDENQVTGEALQWFNANCLYLAEPARDNFYVFWRDVFRIIELSKRQSTAENNAKLDAVLENIDQLHADTIRSLIEGAGGHISDAMLKGLPTSRKTDADR